MIRFQVEVSNWKTLWLPAVLLSSRRQTQHICIMKQIRFTTSFLMMFGGILCYKSPKLSIGKGIARLTKQPKLDIISAYL